MVDHLKLNFSLRPPYIIKRNHIQWSFFAERII